MAAIVENPRPSSVEPPPGADGRLGIDRTHSVNGHVEQNGHFPKKRRRIGKNEFVFAEDDPEVRRRSLGISHTPRNALASDPPRELGPEDGAINNQISGILYELAHRNGTMPKVERERAIRSTIELSRKVSPDAFPIVPHYSVRAHRGKFVGLNSY